MTASVVVCTFNRAGLLSETLKALKAQQAPPAGYEILVVDNNSSDDTRVVTEQLAAEAGAPIRYIFEKAQGLSFARNTGIREATGEAVAFVDDDVDLGADWLNALLAPLADSSVACTGGPVRPIWPAERPSWLTKDWEGFLGISEFETARETGEFRWPTYPWGLNMAFRRSVFDVVGFFPVDLGRIGKGLLANEEISVCDRIETAGYRIRFAPTAVVYHKIHPARLKKQTFYHRAYHQGRSDAILDRRTERANSRVRQFASAMFWGRVNPSADRFDGRCRERLFIGYLSQLLGVHDSETGSSEYRKLRALKLFLSTILGSSSEVIDEKQRHFATSESLVREKSQLIDSRDHQIVELNNQLGELSREIASRNRRLWFRIGMRLGLLGGRPQ